MKALKRKPAVYFENKKDFLPFVNFIKDEGYKYALEDSWMFYNAKNIDKKHSDQIEKVTDEKQLQVFLDIFLLVIRKGTRKMLMVNWVTI